VSRKLWKVESSVLYSRIDLNIGPCKVSLDGDGYPTVNLNINKQGHILVLALAS
jgi:hypothetical protein